MTRARGAALAASLVALACARAPLPSAPALATSSEGLAPEAPPCRYGVEPAARSTALEARVLDLAGARLASRSVRPRTSAALSLAARELARAAAEGRPEALGRARVSAALARACAADPAPTAVLVQASVPAAAGAAADALPRARATHLGAGAWEREGAATVVLLASERTLRLAPFPRDAATGASARLAGTLRQGLDRPRVFVAGPSGQVAETRVKGSREFEAQVTFPAAGRYRVEVVADGEGGPEVAALLTVSAGRAPLEGVSPAPTTEPTDLAAAEHAVARAVNATRRAHGLAPVRSVPSLDAVARGHSVAMAAAGKLAHVLRGSGDVGARLRRVRIPYRRVWENVARAEGALAAHQVAEESPAHLANVLRPEAALLGVGVARVPLASGGAAVYLTEVLVQPPDDGASSPLTPDARVREMLWSERDRLRLPALTADAALDTLARETALSLAARDATEPPADLADRALALRRNLAAVDVFVASAPGDAARSANVRDRRWRRVGVGVSTGDSRRYGAGRAWIVVVYTD
jgi:uncharacterized protein YkwD